jgi:hypothetical protein
MAHAFLQVFNKQVFNMNQPFHFKFMSQVCGCFLSQSIATPPRRASSLGRCNLMIAGFVSVRCMHVQESVTDSLNVHCRLLSPTIRTSQCLK